MGDNSQSPCIGNGGSQCWRLEGAHSGLDDRVFKALTDKIQKLCFDHENPPIEASEYLGAL